MGHGGDAVLKRWGNICDDAMVFSVTLVTCLSCASSSPFCRLGAPARATGHRAPQAPCQLSPEVHCTRAA